MLADIATFPVGLAYVSAAMKNAGFDVHTINSNFLKSDLSLTIKKIITEHKIDVVCTGGTSLDVHSLSYVINEVRCIKPTTTIIVGGPIISADPDTAMKVLGADIGVIGEGEETICDLALAIENRSDLRDVAGLIYCSNGQLYRTSNRPEIIDINSSPGMDFDGWAYSEWLAVNNYSGIINSARSCPFNCTFCFKSTGNKYRQRTLDSVFEDIDSQIIKYNITSLNIIDELFATDSKRVLEFCARIKKYNLTWGASLRVPEIDADLLRLMKDSGCTGISTGLESGAPEVLKSMRKVVTIKQLENALDVFATSEMVTLGNFIFGDIAETQETINKTIDVWKKYNNEIYINLGIVAAFPGSYIYDFACRNKIITDREKYLKGGSFIVNITGMDDSDYLKMISQVTELGFLPQIPAKAVKIEEASDEGLCKVTWQCRRCELTHTLDNTHFLQAPICTCSCGFQNTIEPFRDVKYYNSELIAALPKDEVIAFWGVGSQYYRMARFYGSLTAERFIQIDGNEHQQKMTRLGKKIYGPEVLISQNIKTVIITSPIAKNAILKAITDSSPSVTDVFYPALMRIHGELVPVFQNITPTKNLQ